MRTLLLALVVLAIVVPAAPVATAHHTGCQPDYPCDPMPPCSAKCWLAHLTWMAKCAVDPNAC